LLAECAVRAAEPPAAQTAQRRRLKIAGLVVMPTGGALMVAGLGVVASGIEKLFRHLGRYVPASIAGKS
jgi:hypothetical protein